MDIISKNFNAIPDIAFTKSEELSFENVKVFLNFNYKTIPEKPSYITFTVPHNYKHSICIVIKDLDRNSEISIKKFQKLLTKESIDISNIRILPLKELTLMQFEEKRKLSSSYEKFFVDKRIAHRGVQKLGKAVLKSHNHPIPIDFKTGVSKAINFGKSHIRMALKAKGATESVEIGNLDMDREKIQENFMSSVKVIIEKWPGSISNIRSIYVKAAGPSYPVYYDEK